MKRVIFVLLATVFGLNVNAQNVTQDQEGNFHAIATAPHDSLTDQTYTDAKGKIVPVFVGYRGGFYVARFSKPSARNNYTSRYYRKYLKVNAKEQPQPKH